MPRQANSDIVNPYTLGYNRSRAIGRIRVGRKNREKDYPNHHHTIASKTDEHAALILGAIPRHETLHRISEENQGKKVIRVSLLTDDEENLVGYDDKQSSIHMPLFDHSVMDPETGLGITVEKAKVLMGAVAGQMNDKGNVVYFHCMAGHSRSGSAVAAFLYLHPEFLTEEVGNDYKSVRDVFDFVRTKRPKVTRLERIKDGQRSLLGLIALDQQAEKLNSSRLREDGALAQRVAQDVVFILYAPLDGGFRDQSDRKKEEENFARLYSIYKEAGYDLLLNMLPEGLGALVPNARAHLAILAQNLVSIGIATKEELESSLGCSLDELAQKAAEDPRNLSAGNQVELLRSFGANAGLDFNTVARNVLRGTVGVGGDRKEQHVAKHNIGIQLADLYDIAGEHEMTHDFVQRLNAEEKREFYRHLATLDHVVSVSTQGFQKMVNPLQGMKMSSENIMRRLREAEIQAPEQELEEGEIQMPEKELEEVEIPKQRQGPTPK